MKPQKKTELHQSNPPPRPKAPAPEEFKKEKVIEPVDNNENVDVMDEPAEQKLAKLEPKEQTKIWIANNYFSIGIDSKILLDFDNLRNSHPSYFPHRMVNFGWYGLIGIKSMMEAYQSLRHYVLLSVKEKDKTELTTIRLPKKVKALVFLNVPSYSGGTNPWRTARNTEKVPEQCSQSINDGIIEIFGMEGAFHIGRNLFSVTRGGIRVAQAEEVSLITLEFVSGQVDGEPYFLHPCKITIQCSHQSHFLFCNSNDPEGIKYDRLRGKGLVQENKV